jgi:hypothetical protein
MEEEDRDVITTLQVDALAQFCGLEELESRMTPFQEGEDDEEIPTMHAISSLKDTNQGPLTRSRTKKLQEQVKSFLAEINFDIFKNVILPKFYILMLLRFTHEDVKGTWLKDQDTVLQNGFVGKVTWMDNPTQEKGTRMADLTPKRNIHNF